MRPRPSTETELWCGACKAMHPREAFGRSKHEATGLANACKAAVAIRNRLSHARNREQNNARHIALRVTRKTGPEAVTWALKHLLADARGRAQARGLEFALGISHFLCDWPMASGGTCDMPLCTEHAEQTGPDRHLCPKHAAQRLEEQPELF